MQQCGVSEVPSGEGGGQPASVVHRGIAKGFSEEVTPSSEAGAGVRLETKVRSACWAGVWEACPGEPSILLNFQSREFVKEGTGGIEASTRSRWAEGAV